MKNIIFLVTIFFTTNLFSQISIKTGVDKSTIHIGDYINYYILMTYDKNVKPILPAPGTELGQFDIKDYSVKDIKTSDKSETRQKMINYKITTYFLGDFQIPSIEIGYMDKDNIQNVVKTEPLTIQVVPIKRLPTDKDDIRDLKKQISITNYFWLYLFIFILFIIGFYYFYQLYLKKKLMKVNLTAEEKIPILPEDEEAMQKIEELGKKDYLENNQLKQYYFELSEILRAYLHRRYTIYTLERTSYEIIYDLKKILNKEMVHEFEQFFNDTDMVKFAKYIPTSNEIKSIIPVALELIQKTKRSPMINNETI